MVGGVALLGFLFSSAVGCFVEKVDLLIKWTSRGCPIFQIALGEQKEALMESNHLIMKLNSHATVELVMTFEKAKYNCG